MRWLWLTAFFTTFFWLHTVRVYTRGPGSYMWFIVPAVLAAGLGLRRAAARGLDARWLMLLVPVALSIWAVPFPYSVAPAMLSVAALLLACVPFSPNLAWVGVPLGAAGMVLAFQAAAFPLLYILSSRVHEVPSLTPFLYGLVRLFHPGAALSENAIVINYVYDVFEFPTRLEALGIMPAGLFAVAGVALLAVFRRPLKTVLGATLRATRIPDRKAQDRQRVLATRAHHIELCSARSRALFYSLVWRIGRRAGLPCRLARGQEMGASTCARHARCRRHHRRLRLP